MTVALEWLITVHSFSVELHGHNSGIILYTFSGKYISHMSFAALAPPYPRSALAESYYAG